MGVFWEFDWRSRFIHFLKTWVPKRKQVMVLTFSHARRRAGYCNSHNFGKAALLPGHCGYCIQSVTNAIVFTLTFRLQVTARLASPWPTWFAPWCLVSDIESCKYLYWCFGAKGYKCISAQIHLTEMWPSLRIACTGWDLFEQIYYILSDDAFNVLSQNSIPQT